MGTGARSTVRGPGSRHDSGTPTRRNSMAQVTKSACFCGAVQVELSGEPNVQAYCHCGSCRGWLGAPIHAATLWPTASVNVVKGADKLGTFKKTEASHRQFCTSCGSPVLIRHPAIGMTDVPAGTIPGF